MIYCNAVFFLLQSLTQDDIIAIAVEIERENDYANC